MSGQSSLPPVTVYARTVLTVVQAPTWAAAKRIVDANPYLVDTLTDELLNTIAQSAESQGLDRTASLVIQQHRRLFQRCLIVGVAKAFSEVAAAPKGSLCFADGTVMAPEDLL